MDDYKFVNYEGTNIKIQNNYSYDGEPVISNDSVKPIRYIPESNLTLNEIKERVKKNK